MYSENLDPRWLFFASLLDSFENNLNRKKKKELLAPVGAYDNNAASLKLLSDKKLSDNNSTVKYKSTDIIKLNQLPMNIYKQLTILLTPMRVDLNQAVLSGFETASRERPRFKDAIVVRHAGFTAKNNNNNNNSQNSFNGPNISEKDHLSELLRASKLIEIGRKATRDTKFSLFQCDNCTPSNECGLLQVMLGLDFRSSR